MTDTKSQGATTEPTKPPETPATPPPPAAPAAASGVAQDDVVATVTSPLVLIRDGQGKTQYLYQGATITAGFAADGEVDRLADRGLIELTDSKKRRPARRRTTA